MARFYRTSVTGVNLWSDRNKAPDRIENCDILVKNPVRGNMDANYAYGATNGLVMVRGIYLFVAIQNGREFLLKRPVRGKNNSGDNYQTEIGNTYRELRTSMPSGYKIPLWNHGK